MKGNWTMKALTILLSLSFLCIVSCSRRRNEPALRKAVSQFSKAVQNRDIDKLYQFELPEFKKRVSLEEYKAHNLLELADSISAFNYTIKNIRYQKDTAFILTEVHFLPTDSITTDSFKAIFIQGTWYIPTFSSDLNQ